RMKGTPCLSRAFRLSGPYMSVMQFNAAVGRAPIKHYEGLGVLLTHVKVLLKTAMEEETCPCRAYRGHPRWPFAGFLLSYLAGRSTVMLLMIPALLHATDIHPSTPYTGSRLDLHRPRAIDRNIRISLWL